MNSVKSSCPASRTELVLNVLPSLAVMLVAYALPRNRATRWAIYALMIWQIIQQEQAVENCGAESCQEPTEA